MDTQSGAEGSEAQSLPPWAAEDYVAPSAISPIRTSPWTAPLRSSGRSRHWFVMLSSQFRHSG